MSRFGASLMRSVVAAAVALTVSGPISAQPYPSKPVKIIVPFAPGGGVDLTARFIAQRLSTAIGQQFIVENKPGAAGTIAYTTGIKSPPDGSVPVKSIRDLIALAKSKPGKLSYAHTGQGGTSHLAAELFASMAGIKMTSVPYKGGAPALTDTLSGQTDLAFASVAPALPCVKSGRLRALAVTTPSRLASAPEIPTVAESGVPGYEVVQWYGLIGPKGLPSPIVARLNGEVTKVLESKEAAEHLRTEGMSPAGGTPEQFPALIKKEIQIYRKVATDLGLKAE